MLQAERKGKGIVQQNWNSDQKNIKSNQIKHSTLFPAINLFNFNPKFIKIIIFSCELVNCTKQSTTLHGNGVGTEFD